MGVKVRDSGGTLRTLAGIKVRDGGGTLRTIANMKIRDSGGTLRTVYTSGGGGGTSIWIDPPYSDTSSSTMTYHAADFTVGYSGGVVPTSYAWSVVSGTGTILSCAATATARLRCTTGIAYFKCDVVISGTTYTAYVTMTHTFEDFS